MKKILYYNTLFFLLIALLLSCEKQGPDGPEGPEGPAGNPGPPGSGGGTGNGAVIAFTTEATNVFRWEKNDFLASNYTLARAQNPTSVNFDVGFYVNDNEGAIPHGVVLVYVKMKKKNSTQDAIWYAMPHLSGNMAAGSEEYTALQNYRDQTGNNDYLAVTITADVAQNPAAATSPSYDASGVKIIVIASGNVIINSRSRDLKTISLEEVMERYNIKETDFKVLR
jgi:hypothetical protein